MCDYRSECNGGDTKSVSSKDNSSKYNLLEDGISSDANKIEVICNDQVSCGLLDNMND